MVEARTAVRGTAWAIYTVLVLEFLFLISPLAPLFYSFYGPVLHFLERFPETAWLTQFFLPRLSTTADPILNLMQPLGWAVLVLGTGFFLACAVPLYWTMLIGRGQVVGGLYKVIRHPQYVGLAIMGFGVLLIWPRFLVLVSLIVMLGLYRIFAGTEESQCLARFGDSYRAYMAATGGFLPRAWTNRLPRLLPDEGPGRILVGSIVFVATLGLAVAAAFALRSYSLTQVAVLYRQGEALLSPARLNEQEVDTAYATALQDPTVRAALDQAPAGKRLVYIVPQDWDLPVEARTAAKGLPHDRPSSDRTHYKLLFATARSHDLNATGPEMVKDAYDLDPIIAAQVDVATARVTTVEPPPANARWANIPRPTF
jgi:protein-S-isoprenylcysteine O-methyltransferase Ste14